MRPDDLLQFLNQHKPHVVHFSGHGSEENEILLLSDTGRSQPVSSAALRELFRTLKDNIRVVVFNACFSRGQAEAIVENIDWLLHHGGIKPLAGLLRHTRWPDLRTHLIHNLPKLGATPEMVIEQLDREHEISVRRALILTLTEFADGQFSQSEKHLVVKQLLQLYEHDFDPGIHAAAEFALRRFGHTVEMSAMNLSLATGNVEADRRWYLTGQRQCLVLREDGDKLDHLPPGARLAVASHLVTVEQFLRFRSNHDYDHQASPHQTCPVNKVSWYDAAAYCNWLSQREDLPEDQWCYLPNGAGNFAAGMAIASDFHRRSGYRLPSEHEWEYACRAGSEKDYCFGDSEKMLTNYACYSENSVNRMFAVGSLKPNDFGLFDMHGNAWEWCQDMYSVDTTEKEVGDLTVDDGKSRVLRGGSFNNNAHNVRSAYRNNNNNPENRNNNVGFRVASTLRQTPQVCHARIRRPDPKGCPVECAKCKVQAIVPCRAVCSSAE